MRLLAFVCALDMQLLNPKRTHQWCHMEEADGRPRSWVSAFVGKHEYPQCDSMKFYANFFIMCF